MAGRIAILGAGSIGCFVGARLAEVAPVRFLARGQMYRELRDFGLQTRDLAGPPTSRSASELDLVDDPQALADAALILVCVKSQATREAGRQIALSAPPSALVLSMQNGVQNAERLRAECRQCVLAGMVPFNVVHLGQGQFQRSTTGDLAAQHDERLTPWRKVFGSAGLPLHTPRRIAPIQWGKLLLNLNNAVNALAGVPLLQQLRQRSFRRTVAMLQREALAIMTTAGIRPARVTPLPCWLLPHVLELPDAWFSRVAKRMLTIDPAARSSMWEDLAKGRRTEIDDLNGEIVALARTHGLTAPANQRICELIADAERGGRRDYAGDELLRLLRT